jgi:hypothetical protein
MGRWGTGDRMDMDMWGTTGRGRVGTGDWRDSIGKGGEGGACWIFIVVALAWQVGDGWVMSGSWDTKILQVSIARIAWCRQGILQRI